MSEPLQPDEIERIIRAAFVKAMGEDAVAEHEQLVNYLIARAVQDAEVAKARPRARAPIPPGVEALTERLREQYPEARHVDFGERARLEEHIRGLKNVRLVPPPLPSPPRPRTGRQAAS